MSGVSSRCRLKVPTYEMSRTVENPRSRCIPKLVVKVDAILWLAGIMIVFCGPKRVETFAQPAGSVLQLEVKLATLPKLTLVLPMTGA